MGWYPAGTAGLTLTTGCAFTEDFGSRFSAEAARLTPRKAASDRPATRRRLRLRARWWLPRCLRLVLPAVAGL
jgi:hypothetical protein